MKKVDLIFLYPFSSLEHFYTTTYFQALKNLSKKFSKIYFINSSNLIPSIQKKIKKNYKIKSGFIYFDPKNFSEFNKFISKLNPVIINAFSRTFSCFPLLFFLRIKKIPQIVIANFGNLQKKSMIFKDINLKFIIYYFFNVLPKKISTILAILGILSKVEYRYTSYKQYYINFKKKNKFYRFFSYYKEIIFVRSNVYESIYNCRLDNKYILLLDMYPHYFQLRKHVKISKKKVDIHYKRLNLLLNYLKKIFSKKVVVSIHSSYPINFHKKKFPNFDVIKYKTNELISKSFVVVFFNSSAIIHAIRLKKKIVILESEIFKGKVYNSFFYKKALNAKSIILKNEYKFKKKWLLSELSKRIKFYERYSKEYLGSEFDLPGSDQIYRHIEKNFVLDKQLMPKQ